MFLRISIYAPTQCANRRETRERGGIAEHSRSFGYNATGSGCT